MLDALIIEPIIPDLDKHILNELVLIESALNRAKVTVDHVKYLGQENISIFLCDLGFKFENRFFIQLNKKWFSLHEYFYLFEERIVFTSENYLSGGHILLDKNKIFLGGVNFRKVSSARNELDRLGIAKSKIQCFTTKAPFYHLDVVLSILPRNLGVIFLPGIDGISTETFQDREWLYLNWEEVSNFAANLICIEDTIILKSGSPRVEDWLSNRGFQIITVDLDNIPKLGGGPHCCVFLMNHLNDK